MTKCQYNLLKKFKKIMIFPKNWENLPFCSYIAFKTKSADGLAFAERWRLHVHYARAQAESGLTPTVKSSLEDAVYDMQDI